MILPSPIQTGSPQSGSLTCILPKLLSDDKDKPLGPNRTIPKELGGRKVCPLQSCYVLYSLLLFQLLHICAEHRASICYSRSPQNLLP